VDPFVRIALLNRVGQTYTSLWREEKGKGIKEGINALAWGLVPEVEERVKAQRETTLKLKAAAADRRLFVELLLPIRVSYADGTEEEGKTLMGISLEEAPEVRIYLPPSISILDNGFTVKCLLVNGTPYAAFKTGYFKDGDRGYYSFATTAPRLEPGNHEIRFEVVEVADTLELI